MQFKIIKPTTDAQKTTHTTLDTIEVTPNIVRSWKIPPFQRPLRVNDKVRALAEQIKGEDGVIPGVLTIGVLNKERYVVDGQHRCEAFILSECLIGYVDVRMRHFEDLAEMGEEFVNLNSQLVRMRPDDILRGFESSSAGLAKIRKRCPFVGYDQVRRSGTSKANAMLSMSALLRCWFASSAEVPGHSGGASAAKLVQQVTIDEADAMIAFLELAIAAWGRDVEGYRLWGNLNLTLCMWLYRRLVITPYSPRTPKLSRDMFQKCLMSIAADGSYADWLVGRLLSERDRSPAYARMKTIIARRIEAETGKKPSLPSPAWSSHSGRTR